MLPSTKRKNHGETVNTEFKPISAFYDSEGKPSVSNWCPIGLSSIYLVLSDKYNLVLQSEVRSKFQKLNIHAKEQLGRAIFELKEIDSIRKHNPTQLRKKRRIYDANDKAAVVAPASPKTLTHMVIVKRTDLIAWQPEKSLALFEFKEVCYVDENLQEKFYQLDIDTNRTILTNFTQRFKLFLQRQTSQEMSAYITCQMLENFKGIIISAAAYEIFTQWQNKLPLEEKLCFPCKLRLPDVVPTLVLKSATEMEIAADLLSNMTNPTNAISLRPQQNVSKQQTTAPHVYATHPSTFYGSSSSSSQQPVVQPTHPSQPSIAAARYVAYPSTFYSSPSSSSQQPVVQPMHPSQPPIAAARYVAYPVTFYSSPSSSSHQSVEQPIHPSQPPIAGARYATHPSILYGFPNSLSRQLPLQNAPLSQPSIAGTDVDAEIASYLFTT